VASIVQGAQNVITFSDGSFDTFVNIEGIVATDQPDLLLRPWVDGCKIYGRDGADQFSYNPFSCELYGETSYQDKIDYVECTTERAFVFLNNSPATGTLGSKVDTLYTIEYV